MSLKNKDKRLIALLLVSIAVIAFLVMNRNFGTGIYWDQLGLNSVSSIYWGILNPGSTASKTVYIKNGENTSTTLTMTTSNWNPTIASSYITLGWDYGGQALNVGQVIPVKLTLSVSPSITEITDFNFDITITFHSGVGVMASFTLGSRTF